MIANSPGSADISTSSSFGSLPFFGCSLLPGCPLHHFWLLRIVSIDKVWLCSSHYAMPEPLHCFSFERLCSNSLFYCFRTRKYSTEDARIGVILACLILQSDGLSWILTNLMVKSSTLTCRRHLKGCYGLDNSQKFPFSSQTEWNSAMFSVLLA